MAKKRRKKGRNPGGKGGNHERALCRRFSLWLTDDERDDIFWRTGGSGGRAKRRGRMGRSTYGQSGDMGATDPLGDPFLRVICPEFKRGYTKFSLADLLDCRQPQGAKLGQQKYEEFLQQTIESWEQSGAFSWLLIARRNQREDICLLPLELFNALGLQVHRCRAPIMKIKLRLRFFDKPKKKGCRGKIIKRMSLMIVCMTLRNWFHAVSPKRILKVAQKLRREG